MHYWLVFMLYNFSIVYLIILLNFSLDLNECDVKNGGCNQICTNTYGNFVCSCQEGYLLQIDGFNCQGMVDTEIIN